MADQATAALYASPEIVAIYDKWFLHAGRRPRGSTTTCRSSPALRYEFAQPTDSPNPDDYHG